MVHPADCFSPLLEYVRHLSLKTHIDLPHSFKSTVWLYSSLCNQSPIYGHLSCCQISAMINNAAVFLYTFLFMHLWEFFCRINPQK